MEIPSTFVLHPQKQSQESPDFDLSRYWRAIQRRWLPALGAGAAVLGLTAGAVALYLVWQARGFSKISP